MVKGLPRFREHFADYQDHYVLIGGSACDVQFDEAGIGFRATKDLDIVFLNQKIQIFLRSWNYFHVS